ncbi:hypothetical protein KJ885_03345 [Patescibacteria group bacterium]|nr:hypothetical protein [Patescibacteria group bacterium]
MQVYNVGAEDLKKLLDIVGASNINPSDRGPVVVRVNLSDGRVIKATYHNCKMQEIDVSSPYDIFLETEPLVPFVKELLSKGKSFITDTGSHDMVCTLKWTIERP